MLSPILAFELALIYGKGSAANILMSKKPE
jgi:hypothetical protein